MGAPRDQPRGVILVNGQPPNLGRYRIVGELGRGGMGIVYRAVDPELDREVAVKLILLAPDASRELRDELEKRFRREAKAAARIRHPGVVSIHDVGSTEWFLQGETT